MRLQLVLLSIVLQIFTVCNSQQHQFDDLSPSIDGYHRNVKRFFDFFDRPTKKFEFSTICVWKICSKPLRYKPQPIKTTPKNRVSNEEQFQAQQKNLLRIFLSRM